MFPRFLFSPLLIASALISLCRAEKPNIIFIMADDLGYADLGCYGQELIKTPRIDQLAREGTRFMQCYSGTAVCAPARSVLMTGLHTGHTRVRGNFGIGGVVGLAGGEGRVPLRAEDLTIAQVLQQGGYSTGMVGKWGLGEPNTEGEPNRKGFDEFFGFLNQRRAHTYYPDYIWNNTEKVELPGNRNHGMQTYTQDLFTDYAVDFIKRHQEEAFFLYLPFCIPHDKYEVPDLGDYENEPWTRDEKAYASMIGRLDLAVGRIMKTLKDLGIDENTYVFFTSDNGVAETPQSWGRFDGNGPLKGTKRDAYEGGIRVPMIVRRPGVVPAGKTNEDLVWYFADVFPTLASIAGLPVPEGLDGVNALPTLRGERQAMASRYLYWEFYEQQGWQATRFGDWKAIRQGMNSGKPGPIELYNLKDDLGETRDLAERYPELVKQAEEIFKEAHVPSEHYKWNK